MQPQTVMMDFELAAMQSAEDVFTNATVHGCFYHLTQNVYRKVQAEGLQTAYCENPELATQVRMLMAIAFVPLTDVVSAFEAVQEAALPEITPIVDYFEDTYVGRMRRRTRAPPRYPPAQWNIHARLEIGLPRTNNNVEGWHRHMQAAVAAHHPNIWRFIQVLRKDHSLNHVRINQMNAGQAPPPARKMYADVTLRIRRIVDDFPNRYMLDFLRCISYNIRV